MKTLQKAALPADLKIESQKRILHYLQAHELCSVSKISRDLGGRKKAFTASYDDGITQDFRLIELFKKYDIKATFNLNSGLFGETRSFDAGIPTTVVHVSKEDVRDLYDGFEVAVHTRTHPILTIMPENLIVQEIVEDKKCLEELVGYPVRGMALPYGAGNSIVTNLSKMCGIEYIRTVQSHRQFRIPDNFMCWNPTCHHTVDNLNELGKEFLKPSMEEQTLGQTGAMQLFYLWGHSYEFDYNTGQNSWTAIEEFLKLISYNEDIWYASNVQILDYVAAQRMLRFSAEESSVYNPSCLDVWISLDEEAVCIEAGKCVRF